MDELKEFLSPGWVGTVIGIVGIIIAIALAFFFASRPKISTQANTLDLVGPNAVLPHEIEFVFRGKKVPQVTLSKIAIWNSGNTTIKGDQIVDSDPLRILVSEGNVLETKILHRTREVNDFSLALDPLTDNQIKCRFDYLDVGDGALIQIIHTGTDKVSVIGTLRGIPKGVLQVGNPYKKKSHKADKLSRFQAKVLSLISLLFGIIFSIAAISGAVVPQQYWPVIAYLGFIFILFGLTVFWSVSCMPPGELSTQITSNEPKKSIWQILMGKMG